MSPIQAKRSVIGSANMSTAKPSPELQAALDASPKAAAAFAALRGAARYSILYRIANLRTLEGRDHHIATCVAMLELA